MIILNLKRFRLNRRFRCLYSSQSLTKSKKFSRTQDIQNFFNENPALLNLKKYIPAKYLTVNRKLSPENVYLICPKTAKVIADLLMPALDLTGNQLISETNAGLGLIATELLERGVKLVRLYEHCPDFRAELKDFGTVYPGRVELFTKDLFHLHRYAYMDKQDKSNRVQSLLKNVPRRSWIDEPVLTVVGSLAGLDFIKYLIYSLALQSGPATYGRLQMFAIMRPRDFAILSATTKNNLYSYKSWTILFNLIFDYELLDKFPRNIFLPWEASNAIKNNYPSNLEPDKMYLVKINFKKELPLSTEQILPLYYFIKQFYGRGNNKIIPTIEKWVPDCGLNIIFPALKHDDYFENVDIFTRFRELTPTQILSVFKEIIHYPTYSTSPFTAMIENELLKTETIETTLADATLEKNIMEDIEEKLNFK